MDLTGQAHKGVSVMIAKKFTLLIQKQERTRMRCATVPLRPIIPELADVALVNYLV